MRSVHLLVAIALLSLGVVSPTVAAEARRLVLATGEIQGYFYPIGGALCRAVSKAGGGRLCLVAPTTGSGENVAMLRSGAADLAIVQSRVLWEAFQGREGFEKEGAFQGFRTLLALHDESALLLVRKQLPFKSADDLKGKRFAGRPAGSFVRRLADAFLAGAGLAPADLGAFLEVESERVAKAFCNGEVDAAILAGVHPLKEAVKAIAECGAVPHGVPDQVVAKIVDANPFLYRIRLEAGLYEPLKAPLSTFGTRALLVATDRLNVDDGYAVAKAVAENLDGLGRYHPALKRLGRKELAQPGAGIALHPGAEKYFKE